MKNLMLVGLLGIGLMAAPAAQAQPVRFGVSIGVGPAWVETAPVCTYGYYSYYPYACAPYGFYGPEWFSGGVFIGAGPWFHGYHGRDFNGRPGYSARRGFEGRQDFRGEPRGRGPARNERGPSESGFRGGNGHGGGSFHGGGGSHGGGHR